jgi:hypothetical protein
MQRLARPVVQLKEAEHDSGLFPLLQVSDDLGDELFVVPSLLCSASLIELAVLRPLNRSTSARVKFETEQVSLTDLLISAER